MTKDPRGPSLVRRALPFWLAKRDLERRKGRGMTNNLETAAPAADLISRITDGAYDNASFNAALEAIEERDDLQPERLRPHGKVLPYIGWYWRRVDFSRPIRLGDCGAFVGFMEDNKWGNDEWEVAPEAAATILADLIRLVGEPTTANAERVFDVVQRCGRDRRAR